MKRLLVLVCITVMFCSGVGAATFGPQSLASTPDAEFVTLSDMASTPVAATAGDSVAAVGAVAMPQEPTVVTPAVTSSEGASNVVTTGVTSGVVVVVKQAADVGQGTNVVVASDTSAELMPVASFGENKGKQNLISVALDDVPLQDVVRLFTRISGANIISSSTNLQGKVTVNLQDVEWKPALDSILDMYSLMVSEKVPGSGIYSVMNKVPGSEPMIAQPIFLEYTMVSNIIAVLIPMVGKGGTISSFPSANAIVVRTTAADLSSIIKIVSEIDVPRQQVYIEVKILELTDEAIKDLGVNWQSLGGGLDGGYKITAGTLRQTLTDTRNKFNSNNTSGDQTDLRKSADSTKNALDSTLGLTSERSTSDSIDKTSDYKRGLVRNRDQTLSDVRTAVLSPADFSVVLSALKQISGITVVSNPKIIVANQETATIHVGDNVPNIKTTVTPGQQGQANTLAYDLNDKKPYFEFGVSLTVTPTINNHSNIIVNIEPKLSSPGEVVQVGGISFPGEIAKTIKTVFSLESGKTAAIGGLIETKNNDKVVKIPLLGDIPLIGKYLFSYTHKQHKQVETIIFVTVGLANSRTLLKDEGIPEETALAQNHLLVMKQLRDQRKAGAVKAAEKEKADALKAVEKANAKSAKREQTP